MNAFVLSCGIGNLLLIQYIPLFAGNTLMWPNENLLGIVAVQIIPLMVIVATISTYFYHKAGHVYVGAFLNAIFITWYIGAGQATHFVV